MEIQFKKPDYIVIYVSDMARSTAFYRDVLGLPLRFTSPGWTEFATGDVTLALHLGGAPGDESTERRPPAGRAQLAFVVDDIHSAYEVLKARERRAFLDATGETGDRAHAGNIARSRRLWYHAARTLDYKLNCKVARTRG